jgi:hypothetical protein
VDADRALVLAAAAEHRTEREVRLDVVDVLLDHPAQLADHRVVIARDQMRQRAHVRLAVTRGATQLAIIGHVIATDQHTRGHRAEADEQQDQRCTHRIETTSTRSAKLGRAGTTDKDPIGWDRSVNVDVNPNVNVDRKGSALELAPRLGIGLRSEVQAKPAPLGRG